jgi:hypothetical protein
MRHHALPSSHKPGPPLLPGPPHFSLPLRVGCTNAYLHTCLSSPLSPPLSPSYCLPLPAVLHPNIIPNWRWSKSPLKRPLTSQRRLVLSIWFRTPHSYSRCPHEQRPSILDDKSGNRPSDHCLVHWPHQPQKAANEVRLYHCQLLAGLRTDELSLCQSLEPSKMHPPLLPQRYVVHHNLIQLH